LLTINAIICLANKEDRNVSLELDIAACHTTATVQTGLNNPTIMTVGYTQP